MDGDAMHRESTTTYSSSNSFKRQMKVVHGVQEKEQSWQVADLLRGEEHGQQVTDLSRAEEQVRQTFGCLAREEKRITHSPCSSTYRDDDPATTSLRMRGL